MIGHWRRTGLMYHLGQIQRKLASQARATELPLALELPLSLTSIEDEHGDRYTCQDAGRFGESIRKRREEVEDKGSAYESDNQDDYGLPAPALDLHHKKTGGAEQPLARSR